MKTLSKTVGAPGIISSEPSSAVSLPVATATFPARHSPAPQLSLLPPATDVCRAQPSKTSADAAVTNAVTNAIPNVARNAAQQRFSSSRRVLAVTFPRLLLELACLQFEGLGPFNDPQQAQAVVLVENKLTSLGVQSKIDAVNDSAHKRGVVPGLLVTQGLNRIEELHVHTISRQHVTQKLQQFANVALQLGSPVSFAFPDTVWVDITGSSHLFDGEEKACLALHRLLNRQGHSCRIAVSNGAWSAQAFSHFCQTKGAQERNRSRGSGSTRVSKTISLRPYIVNSSNLEREIGQLPIRALPLSGHAMSWLQRLGLRTIVDLRKLPQADLLARLKGETFPGAKAFRNRQRVFLDQIRGHDNSPLIPYLPTTNPIEKSSWDEPIHHVEPLLLHVHELLRRLSICLEERGQAARQLFLTLRHDRAIARYKNCPLTATIQFALTTPLQHARDLLRIVDIRLERYTLLAPVVEVELKAGSLTVAPQWQLSLGQSSLRTLSPGRTSPGRASLRALSSGASLFEPSPLNNCSQELQLLFAELVADLGAQQVGMLVAQSAPLLEGRSAFHSIVSEGRPASGMCLNPKVGSAVPTQVLHPPIGIHTNLRENTRLTWQGCSYYVTRKVFLHRQENVEWWQGAPVHRDYYRLWLTCTGGGAFRGTGLSLLVFLNRSNGSEQATSVHEVGTHNSYIHALFD